MNTVADIQKAMTPGTAVIVTNHVYPALSGERVVLRRQTKQWLLSFPVGHPKYAGGDHAGSWLDVPKRTEVTFDDDNTFTITRAPEWGDSGPFCTITVLR